MSRIKRAYRYRFYPTDEQKQLLARTFGCVRYVYNWALDLRQQTYRETSKGLSYKALDAQMTILRHQEVTSFLSGVSCVPLQQSLRHLMRAYTNFFAGRAQFPTFKKAAGTAVGHLYQKRLFVQGRHPDPRQDEGTPRDTLVAPTSRRRTAFHSDDLLRPGWPLFRLDPG